MDYLTGAVNLNETGEEFLAMLNGGVNVTYANFTDFMANMTTTLASTLDPHLINKDGMNPSPYTLTTIVIASVIVTILMIIIVVGNMLVIIAIATEKSLKNIQNWFIASLAVADFFLGLIIMPFSLAKELMGYWVFGDWWCDIHSALDVLLCTSSIMNLCLISLDRYWSITQAIEYLRSRTPARAAFMITAVWIMSGLISIPPLLGWKGKKPEGDLPQCQLSEDIGYVLYSALGSFYIPSCIMVFVYIRIYYAAKARARRGIRKQPRKPPNEQETNFSNPKASIPMPSGPSASNEPHPMPNQQQQIATIEQPPMTITTNGTSTGTDQQVPGNSSSSSTACVNKAIPVVTCDFASDMSTSEAGAENEHEAYRDTLKVDSNTVADVRTKLSTLTEAPLDTNGNTPTDKSDGKKLTIAASAGRNRALSVGVEIDAVSEFEPSSSDSGVVSRCAVVKPLKFRLCQPIFGKRILKLSKDSSHQNGNKKNKNNKSKVTTVAVTPTTEIQPAPKPKPRDPEKEKRRIARKKEKRATLILGLIMGSFIACWLPFFFLYILTPMCSSCQVPDAFFALAFWLGYMNSALNPAIYTIFNKDFRRAFRRILFK